MKFLHLADLHIGKRVCEHSMLEDQKHILASVVEAVVAEKPDGVLIAGDVYDKSVPSAEAVAVLDDFLVKLSETGSKVFVISGNHDSAERIAFGGRLMENRGVYMSPVYDGAFAPVTLNDEFGEVDVWMLPFVRPADVRAAENAVAADSGVADVENSGVADLGASGAGNSGAAPEIANFTDAIRVALSHAKFTPGRRNVLVAHQFVTGAKVDKDGSEENVGGLDNVDASVFEAFDYVALGHIHGPQNICSTLGNATEGAARVRYCGTPLKYSLSEASHKKSITVVELGAGRADLSIREIPLVPLHDVRKIRGTFAELVSAEFREQEVRAGHSPDDYVYVELTDENDVPDAALRLRTVYRNFMTLTYDNARTRSQSQMTDAVDVGKKTPLALFEDFYKAENGHEMLPEQHEFMESLIRKIWEGEA
ncbi:MAG: exonuclease SbcCD subunit D [Fibrobacter sp.]|nr:exonuclease SbcCD subunit D [Fibrobacter sp.]